MDSLFFSLFKKQPLSDKLSSDSVMVSLIIFFIIKTDYL
ncbi:hypothetical protein BTURTLESOX_2118 [bacterium endosymbiont of Bathymodiolus sp. 5 South]|nr:hypothetical protein BTURTLESOX_2118 [bacterium endosymbiont of Bathymodiolus sp. 5 South]